MLTDDMVTTQRVASVVEALVLGNALTTRQVAEMTGITRQGAYELLARVSLVLPVYLDGNGLWRYVPTGYCHVCDTLKP